MREMTFFCLSSLFETGFVLTLPGFLGEEATNIDKSPIFSSDSNLKIQVKLKYVSYILFIFVTIFVNQRENNNIFLKENFSIHYI